MSSHWFYNTINVNFVDDAMGWSTRIKQLHMEERSMKSSPSGCSDDLALVWLLLHHLASCNVSRIVVLNRGHPDPASWHIIVLVRFLHTDSFSAAENSFGGVRWHG